MQYASEHCENIQLSSTELSSTNTLESKISQLSLHEPWFVKMATERVQANFISFQQVLGHSTDPHFFIF